ncbi:mechanosensitive ion channel family protein [Roseibium litorale]|uniref:Mechanosensitive ion channel family protein n=1 Tax=Roseibium litorale TaxID=2803841 RepID=A0ABR9CIG6_9HYPH|nr:mechanosensitive ion channel family protein [Roseibium litorale]MBD8890610.1 mechanosensitive ion channel family protein [Roseibium litorale]
MGDQKLLGAKQDFLSTCYRLSRSRSSGKRMRGERLQVFAVFLAALVVLTGLCGSGAGAQGIPGLFSAAAAKNGTPPETSSAAPAPVAAIEADMDEMTDLYLDRGLAARDAARNILQMAPELPGSVTEMLRAKGMNGSLDWIGTTLLVTAVGFVIGGFFMQLVGKWGLRQFDNLLQRENRHRADRIAYLFLRAIAMLIGIVAFVVVSGAVLLALSRGPAVAHQSAMILLGVAALFLVIRTVYLSLLSPYDERARMVQLSNKEAGRLYGALLFGTAVAGLFFAVTTLMGRLGLEPDALKLTQIASAFAGSLILVWIVIAFRAPVRRLIQGEDAESAPLWRRVLGKGWHILAAGYFLLAFLISAVRILLDLPSGTGLVIAPIEALLAAGIAYGVFVLIIDRLLLPRLDTELVETGIAQDILRAEATEGAEEDLAATIAQARAIAEDRESQRAPFRSLLDHGAGILAGFVGLELLLRSWGGSSGHESPLEQFSDVLLVAFLGYMAYRAVEIAIDRHISSQGKEDGHSDEMEIGGAGESRIATLLPIFRNFLLITIVSIAGMVALSQMGVDIGPLFAGAGVVGLAVGFGAQTLIRDIFSGAFYLIDDAFRKGEYIDIGSAKGVVEKISIRSMQLRHHRGALTTVPFGEIQRVENYSRDWAIMKLAFRVTYDTDVELMRKIVKKFGQQLLDDPYYGPMFLQPLKSQGIMSMEDSAMVARVKFTTRPGKQFELRKVVYAGLQELFEKNGIKFAHRQVTVRVADVSGGAALSPEQKVAAGGAALRSLEEQGAGREA